VLIGAHVGAAGGLQLSLKRGAEIGAEVIQIFTQSPRTWSVVHHAQAELDAYYRAQVEFPTVKAVFCHASYLINLCSSDPSILSSSRDVLSANLVVATQLRSCGVVLHVGSHKGHGLSSCLDQVTAEIGRSVESAAVELERAAQQLKGNLPTAHEVSSNIRALESGHSKRTSQEPGSPGMSSRGWDGTSAGSEVVPLLLENTAGAGGTIGRSLEELSTILEALDKTEIGVRPGICLDTQHLWASGVSYSTPDEVDHLLHRVEKLIGLDRLGCIHLNDSKTPLGSERDRHENLGKGMIGEHSLALLIGHPKLQSVPVILEVPGGGSGPDRDQIGIARHIHELGCSMWR